MFAVLQHCFLAHFNGKFHLKKLPGSRSDKLPKALSNKCPIIFLNECSRCWPYTSVFYTGRVQPIALVGFAQVIFFVRCMVFRDRSSLIRYLCVSLVCLERL